MESERIKHCCWHISNMWLGRAVQCRHCWLLLLLLLCIQLSFMSHLVTHFTVSKCFHHVLSTPPTPPHTWIVDFQLRCIRPGMCTPCPDTSLISPILWPSICMLVLVSWFALAKFMGLWHMWCHQSCTRIRTVSNILWSYLWDSYNPRPYISQNQAMQCVWLQCQLRESKTLRICIHR